MRWPLLWVFCFSWIGWAGHAHARALSIAPTPAWVERREAASASASVSSVDGPVTYLLVDRQESFIGSAPQFHFRLVGRINNSAGLDEMSQILAEFDPEHEKLFFHEIRIRREQDEPVIRLKADDFELIRREKESEKQIFDGTLTASFLLHDLRVGDVVDYSYSIVGQHPLLGKRYSGRHDLNWNVPVFEAHIRQIWPADTELHWKVSRPEIAIQQRVEGTRLITQWTGRRLPPQLEEDHVPGWVEAMDTYAFSSWQSWEEVVRWALPFYEVTEAGNEAVAAMAQRIRERVRERKAQVEEAIRLVQDDIRYVGIELGAGSFVPRQPDEVLRKRFGDCKDKALLLTRLIQALGYEAFPILVRSEGGLIDQQPPTPEAFNHVVVGVRNPETGDLYWVDGTLQHQGFRLESRDYRHFQQGLPLVPGNGQLLKQEPGLIPQGRISCTERYESQDFHEPLLLSIKSTFSGWQAEKMRSDLAARGSVVLSDDLANFVKKMHPAAVIDQAPVFEDDRFSNELTITESYSIPDIWRKMADEGWRLELAAGAFINQYLLQPEKVKRLHPVAQTHPLLIVHRQDIVGPVPLSLPEGKREISNAGFRYRMSQLFQNGALSFVHEWESLSDHVSVQELPRYLEDADAVRQEIGRYVSYVPEAEAPVWMRLLMILPQIAGLFVLFLVAIGWRLRSDEDVQGLLIWPRRSLPLMLLMLLLSCGAFALFWYADADRRWRRTGRAVAARPMLWLSLGIFAAALATRGVTVLMDPSTFQDVPAALLIVMFNLHLLWAVAMLRLVRCELPELAWHSVPALIGGPLYFQHKLQSRPIPPGREPESPAMKAGGCEAEALLPQNHLHPAEDGRESRPEGAPIL